MRLRLLMVATGFMLSACSAERGFSGVWQQVCDDAHPCDAGGVRYALHLGRFGDAVTGLVVRYRDPGPDLDPFRKSNDCGCFIVDSGLARTDGLSFRIDDPTLPGYPDEVGTRDETCEPTLPECEAWRLVLRGDDDVLEGTLSCGNREFAVRFEAVSGRPRTTCLRPTP